MTHQQPPQSIPAAADACELPLQTRMDVRLMPDTAIAEARTIEVLWSTGAAVRRRDPWSGRVYEELLSLDPAHVDAVSRLLRGLATSGCGILVVVHDIDLAARLADQIVLLGKSGEGSSILEHGSPSEVLTSARLESLFGVGFLRADAVAGRVSILRGHL